MARFAAELPAFNAYLERVSALLKLGRTESRLAVYLPNEDNRRLDRIPDDERTPARGLSLGDAARRRSPRGRGIRSPVDLPCLPRSGRGPRRPPARRRLCVLGPPGRRRLARRRCPGRARSPRRRGPPRDPPARPAPPGKRPRGDYQSLLDALRARPNVCRRLDDAGLSPLVAGDDLPPFWARRTRRIPLSVLRPPDGPRAPLPDALRAVPLSRASDPSRSRSTSRASSHPLDLVFEPYQSLLVRVSRADGVQFVDIGYRPPDPACSA